MNFSLEFKLFLGAALLACAFVSGLAVESWRRDSQEKSAFEKKLDAATKVINEANLNAAQSQEESRRISSALEGFNTDYGKLHQEVHSVFLAKQAAPNCPNPFTSDFVRLLNADAGTSSH